MWVSKYRYRVLIGEVRERLKEILRELCEWQEITILDGAIKDDHVQGDFPNWYFKFIVVT